MSFLLGGGGGGGGNQNVTTTTQPPAFQLPNLEFLQNQALQWYNNTPPPSYFPQSQVAGFQPNQLAGQQQVLDYASGALPQLASNAIASNQFFQGAALDPNTNPWLAATANEAAKPIVRSYEQITRPGIENQFLGAGAYGNTRHGIAEGIAGQAALDAIARNTYDLYNQNFQNASNNAIKAQALAPQTLALGTQPGALTSSVGDVQQAQDQAQLDDAVKRFYFEQGAPFQHLAQFAGLVSGDYGSQTNSQTSASGGGPTFGSIAGGALTGLAAANQLGGLLGMTSGALAPWGFGIGALLSLL